MRVLHGGARRIGGGHAEASLCMERCHQLQLWSQADAPQNLVLCDSQCSRLSRAREVACAVDGTTASSFARTAGRE